MIPRRAVKIKFFLSVVIPVVKSAFVPFSAIGGKPAIARAARLCGVSPCPVPDTATALPNVAPYQLSHTRIFNFSMIPRRTVKIKIFLSVVIYVVKATFMPFSATGGKPAIARVVRPSGLLSKPRMDRVYALPKQARYQLRYTRLFRYFIRPVAFTQIKRDTSFATPGYLVLWGGEPLYGTVCGRRRLQGNGMEH